MTGRIDWLYKLYHTQEQPCFCFGEDFAIRWINPAAMQEFPDLAVDSNAVEALPQFPLHELQALKQTATVSHPIYNRFGGMDRLEVLIFSEPKEETLYVAVHYPTVMLQPANSHQPVNTQLFSYHIRQRMTNIFTLAQLLSERMVQQDDYESVHRIRAIERNCRSMLKLSYNFNAYYAALTEDSIYPTEVNFHAFLTPLVEQSEMLLAATDLTFIFDPDYQNGTVLIDEALFTIAILNVINISCLYAKEGGKLICRTEFFQNEMLLTFEDNVTDFMTITTAVEAGSTLLDATGEPPAMKKMCYDILQKVIEVHGGQCQIIDNHPGVKISIRMKAQPIDTDYGVHDESVYTSKRKASGTLGMVDIMLSDITN